MPGVGIYSLEENNYERIISVVKMEIAYTHWQQLTDHVSERWLAIVFC